MKNKELKLKSELNCHSGITKEEILEFVQIHRGETVVIHYEHKLSKTWKTNDFWELTLNEKGIQQAYNLVSTRYIHKITVL